MANRWRLYVICPLITSINLMQRWCVGHVATRFSGFLMMCAPRGKYIGFEGGSPATRGMRGPGIAHQWASSLSIGLTSARFVRRIAAAFLFKLHPHLVHRRCHVFMFHWRWPPIVQHVQTHKRKVANIKWFNISGFDPVYHTRHVSKKLIYRNAFGDVG